MQCCLALRLFLQRNGLLYCNDFIISYLGRLKLDDVKELKGN